MFTGLIEHQATVVDTAATAAGCRIVLDPDGWGHEPAVGDSIAVNGCCLTLVEGPAGTLAFDVIPQTLTLTTLGGLSAGDRVNLEAAASMQSRFDGHMVQGHIEGTGAVVEVTDDDTGRRLRVHLDAGMARCCVPQGSIAIDGVSLTISGCGDDWIEVALIPLTLERTTLGQLRPEDRVNIETDVLARHVARLLDAQRQP